MYIIIRVGFFGTYKLLFQLHHYTESFRISPRNVNDKNIKCTVEHLSNEDATP